MSSVDLVLGLSMATFVVSVVGTAFTSWVAWRRMRQDAESLELERKKLAWWREQRPTAMMVGPRVEEVRAAAQSWKLMKVFVSTSMLITLTIPISLFWWGINAEQLWKWALTEYVHSLILYAGMKLWKRIRPKQCRGVLG